jgi:tRNA threonylcarbamoyladenosine biosynthesis protein TsaE
MTMKALQLTNFEWVFTTSAPEETQKLGFVIGELVMPGDWIGLSGDLGAGKTCFVKGVARGLSADPTALVTSPTFVLLQIYPGRIPLYHFDLYRIHALSELSDIGYEEYWEGDGLCVVEWPDQVPDSNPGRGLLLSFVIVDENVRTISFRAEDPRGQELLSKVAASLRGELG